MKHDWQIVVKYDSHYCDWVCKLCSARVDSEELPFYDRQETIEEFQARIGSEWEAWRNIPQECPGNQKTIEETV
jgi:hypothetical protein